MRRHEGRSDLVGGIVSFLLLVLLALLVAAQIGLALPSWRPRLSLLDSLEGVPLGEKDLPSVVDLW